MTLEEIIKHCENVADYDCFNDDQRKCSEEHRRIAEWLKEIKETEPGEWIVLDECRNAGVYCSNCNKKIFKLDFSNTMKWKDFKYCPHCGKEMDGRRYMNVKPMKCSEIPNDSDCISRQAAIDALEKVADMFPWRVPGNRDTYDRYNEAWNDAIGRAEMEIENLPSAQPDLDEWCTDCKEYDAKKHHCPRFNRVIREALKDALEQLKTEKKTGKSVQNVPKKDLISRQAAIDARYDK